MFLAPWLALVIEGVASVGQQPESGNTCELKSSPTFPSERTSSVAPTGLRREETALLTLEHIQQRDARWVIVDMSGKGGRVRSVPMPSWTKAAIDDWTGAADLTSGRVFRRVNKGGHISGDSLAPQSIFEMVKVYGAEIGLKEIAPHDLRRTFAKLAHKGRAALEQIQLSLGHASIQTTERYLGDQGGHR